MPKLVKFVAKEDDYSGCLYCGTPILKGDNLILDEPLDSVFCSEYCDKEYRKLYPEQDQCNPLETGE